MKKIIALSLFLCVILSSCSFNKSVNNDTGSNNIQERQATDVVGSEDEDVPEFTNLSDPELCSYLEKNIYTDVITTLDSADYLVEDVKLPCQLQKCGRGISLSCVRGKIFRSMNWPIIQSRIFILDITWKM